MKTVIQMIVYKGDEKQILRTLAKSQPNGRYKLPGLNIKVDTAYSDIRDLPIKLISLRKVKSSR